ncbi:hypothetical protein [Paenibacillus sp. FSL H8-0034]
MSKIGIAIGGGEAFSLPSVFVGLIIVLAIIGLKTVYRNVK